MAKVEGGKFGSITWKTQQGPACCGECQVYELGREAAYRYQNSKMLPLPAWETQTEQLEDFWKRFMEQMQESSDDYFEDNDDRYGNIQYAFATMTLIDDQIPGMIDFLKTKGWNVDFDAINPKTDNRIYHMSYLFND